MRTKLAIAPLLGASTLLSATAGVATASEYAFSTYALGSNAFGAGITPPAGTYLTTVSSYYPAKISGELDFGGVLLNAGAKIDGFASALNLLYVPSTQILGGNLGLSVTVPVGHLDIKATVDTDQNTVSRQTDGWGLGDTVPKLQLGWQHGDFAHTLYVQGTIPTGRWQRGFSPIIGLHRPSIDTGWAFTWTDKPTKLQFNGVAGVTFNFENTETNYKSGTEFHFEWAIGYEIAQGFLIGVVGYDYRQLTGDSGEGARLGSFKGRVDAIGPGLSYTTMIGDRPLTLNLRNYQEYNAKRRWEGNATIGSATLRF